MNLDSLRIALTADPELPVPPSQYGGIERIIDMLVRGLVERGHEVTLFAHPDSASVGHHVPWKGMSSASKSDSLKNAALLMRHVMMDQFDIVHSFSRIAYMTAILPLRIPKLMTYQRKISLRTVEMGFRLSRGTLEFSAISDWMMSEAKYTGRWHMVPNGVPLSTYTFQNKVADNAPLVFLGRIEAIKGPHLAIEVAMRTGIPLVIAGNIPNEHQQWFEQKIAPHIDGKLIHYIGPVDDKEKNRLLGQARAFLMPILWEEPFGIVMAESMACGTPVVGFRRGAVTEVVEDGVTGFVRDTMEELIECVGKLSSIDRAACRERVERYYSDDKVTDAYLSVYRLMLETGRR